MKYSLKNGLEMIVRDLEVEDAAEMLAYLKQVGGESDFLTFGPEGVGYTLEEEQDFIRSKADDPCNLFLAGTINDRIIASLGLMCGRRGRVSHCGEFGMSVIKDYWSIGVGGYLMDYMLDWARRKSDLTKINLQVREDNIRAISLYMRKGFSFEGRMRDMMKDDDDYYDVFNMGLRL